MYAPEGVNLGGAGSTYMLLRELFWEGWLHLYASQGVDAAGVAPPVCSSRVDLGGLALPVYSPKRVV